MSNPILAFLNSRWFPISRILTAGVSLFIILGGIEMIDVSNIGVPEDYMAVTLAASILLAFLIGLLVQKTVYHKAIDNKVAEGKIKSAADYPMDRRYQFGTLVAMILAIATAMYLVDAVIDSYILGAGLWTYAGIAAIIAGVASAGYQMLIHWGLRECLIRARDYVATIVPEIKETGETIVGSITDLRKEE